MATVVFIVHPQRPEAATLAERAGVWLRAAGHAVEPWESPGVTPGADTVLAVSLGGDGTMLRTVELAWASGTPVLGVNMGQLGFLTEVEPADLQAALERFFAGEHVIEERMLLEVNVSRRGTDLIEPRMAFNEAVVEKTEPGHTIRFAAAIGGRPFATYAADGLLVATPTGSTAYNLSVRGPIVSPTLRAIVVTPISPHMLFDRPLVLEPSEWLELTITGTRPAALVVDGCTIAQLEPGDVVRCESAPRPVRLVRFGERGFHAVLRARFHLADR